MRYRFIDDHRGVWPIGVQCDVLEVARSGYYAWRKRPPSAHAQRRAELTERIQEIHTRKDHDVYGAPRIHQELIAEGHACNRKTVAKCMKAAGIRSGGRATLIVRRGIIRVRPGSQTMHPSPTADAVLDRHFLELRCEILSLAATLDRIARADGYARVSADPRLAQLQEGIRVLSTGGMDRAERVQMLFSDEYQSGWNA